MPKKLFLRYDASTGEVVSTHFYDASTVPAQESVMGQEVQEYDLGAVSDSIRDDVMEAKRLNDRHRVVAGKLLRRHVMTPDALMASEGFTPDPTVENFDERGTMAEATNNATDTFCHLAFPTPPHAPMVGADNQKIYVIVSPSGISQTGTPTVRIEVWEAGGIVPVSKSAEIDVTEARQEVGLSWDAASLSSVDGSKVEVKVFGTKSGGGPAVRNSVNIGKVRWRCWRRTAVN